MDRRVAHLCHGRLRHHRIGVEVLQGHGEPAVGLRHHQRRHTLRHARGEGGRDQAGGRPRRGELAQVFAVVQERDVAGAGVGERPHVVDESCGIGAGPELRADLLRQGLEPDGRRPLEKTGMLHVPP